MLACLSACGGGGSSDAAEPLTPSASSSDASQTDTAGVSSASATTDKATANETTPSDVTDTSGDSAADDAEKPAAVKSSPTELGVFVDSALAPSLKQCIKINGVGCPFSRLPLLGLTTKNPSIDDLMARLLVSHDWMGPRFRQILAQMPPEILRLSRALTAIVISSEVRPSYYDPNTAAIYLDPAIMWLSETELQDISSQTDFRSDFGAELQFVILWRYVKDGRDIRTMARSLNSISLSMAALLFHELAHANDFYPSVSLGSLDMNDAPAYGGGQPLSGGLKGLLPLVSREMADLAAVRFHGVNATSVERTLQPAEVAEMFSADVSNAYYNYATQFEDLAMVFEEAMMYYSFGISREIAITNAPDSRSCSDYIVAWGESRRIAAAAVQARSVYAIEVMLPDAAPRITAVLLEMEAAETMSAGMNWCDNSVSASALEIRSGGVELLRAYR